MNPIPLFANTAIPSVVMVAPSKLQPHPANAEIYGSDESVADLVDKIRQSGWIKPLVATTANVIISGHRRWRAAQLLKWETIPVERRAFADDLAELSGLLLENAGRDKTTEQTIRELETWDRIETKRAESRKIEAGRIHGVGQSQSKVVKTFTPPMKAKARDKVAARAGWSGVTYQKGKKVVAAAQTLRDEGKQAEADALLGVLNNQSINAAAKLNSDPDASAMLGKLAKGEAKSPTQAKKQVQADVIRAEPEPLPTGPFRVIVVDPPWRYDSRAEDETHRARLNYADMSTREICALPVAGMADQNAVLWLWTTNAHMRDAFAVLDAWGFQQKTILTWVKDGMGTGDWLRGQTEHCLMAVRGRPIVTLTNETTVLHGPKREHSRKPDSFFEMVEALCPGSKVEMFARESRQGWAQWGADTGKFDES